MFNSETGIVCNEKMITLHDREGRILMKKQHDTDVIAPAWCQILIFLTYLIVAFFVVYICVIKIYPGMKKATGNTGNWDYGFGCSGTMPKTTFGLWSVMKTATQRQWEERWKWRFPARTLL